MTTRTVACAVLMLTPSVVAAQNACGLEPAVSEYSVLMTGLFGEHRGSTAVTIDDGPTINNVAYCVETMATNGIPDMGSREEFVRRDEEGYYRKRDLVSAERVVFPLPLSVGKEWTETLPTGDWRWRVEAEGNFVFAGQTFDGAFRLRAEGIAGGDTTVVRMVVAEDGMLLRSESESTNASTVMTLLSKRSP